MQEREAKGKRLGGAATYAPLAGVRVLDMGRYIPPALATVRLAALGADVVKIEEPGRGDMLRYAPPMEGQVSGQDLTMNCGKRSIALDLKTEAGRQMFHALAEKADVIVENAMPGFWARQGIDFVAMRAQRPALVVCSISGFGQTGPLSSLPAHGLNMDALSDTLNVVRDSEGPTVGWVYTSWGNELGSLNAALAIVAAVYSARQTGEGAWIDLSCWDAAVESHRAELALSLVTGRSVDMRDRPVGEMYGIYEASDGRLVLLGALEAKFWDRFCKGVGRDDLIALRGEGHLVLTSTDSARLKAELKIIFATATGPEWQRRFLEWQVPGSLLLTVPDLLNSPQWSARAMSSVNVHGHPVVGSPIRWMHTGERAGAAMSPPPLVNEHRAEILGDWLNFVESNLSSNSGGRRAYGLDVP